MNDSSIQELEYILSLCESERILRREAKSVKDADSSNWDDIGQKYEKSCVTLYMGHRLI